VGRNRLRGQRLASLGGVVRVLGDPASERLAGERLAGAGREQRIGRRTGTFGEPRAQDRGGLFGQLGDPLLAALACGGGVRAGAEVDVAAGKAGQLRGAQAGLGEQDDDRVVAAGRSNWSGQGRR
jgi:hypothetical protein